MLVVCSNNFFSLVICSCGLTIVEVKETPFYLSDGRVAFLVPNSHWRSVILIIQTKQKIYENSNITYQMDPQEYAASRNPLSDMDIAVGEFSPIVSILTGFYDLSFLSNLNSPSVVAKKNVCESS